VPIRDVGVDEAETFVMSVASGALTEVADIARELRKLYP
jgi:death on curing protein